MDKTRTEPLPIVTPIDILKDSAIQRAADMTEQLYLKRREERRQRREAVSSMTGDSPVRLHPETPDDALFACTRCQDLLSIADLMDSGFENEADVYKPIHEQEIPNDQPDGPGQHTPVPPDGGDGLQQLDGPGDGTAPSEAEAEQGGDSTGSGDGDPGTDAEDFRYHRPPAEPNEHGLAGRREEVL